MAEPNATTPVQEHHNEKRADPLHFTADEQLKQTDSMKQTVIDAKKASDSEHSMSLIQGVKLYPKAIMWSVIISTCIAMEGYDVALVNNFYAFEPFRRQFGEEISPGRYEVSSARDSPKVNNCASSQ
jgi:SP family general alpha glucoside:H+ symporter-like MFS transporter